MVDSAPSLGPEALEWLREGGVHASQEDLDETYELDHHLVSAVAISSSVFRAARSFLKWRVQLFGQSGTGDLTDRPIVRTLHHSLPLHSASGEHGRVARNEQLFLRKDYRGQELGSQLYEREFQRYQAWDVREIHMRAVEAGRVVWLKPRFGFRPVALELLRVSYREWATTRGMTEAELPNEPADYPEAFLS